MLKHRTDVAILGAGTAGLSAYRAAKDRGAKVLLIDGGPLGTTCARVGCMPSKLLIAAAESAHHCRRSALFGVQCADVNVDSREVMARVRRERDRFVGDVMQTWDDIPEHEKIRSRAYFEDDQTLHLDNGDRVVANSIVIATGSRTAVPEALRPAGERLLDNETLFDLEQLPTKVAVFGPGIIGLELGQALHRLGVHIRLFGVKGSSVGPLRDPATQAFARQCFSEEFPISLDAEIDSVALAEDGVQLRWQEDGGERRSEQFDYLLVAAGRQPNVDRMQLHNTSLQLDRRGVPDYNAYTMQCGKSGIFVAGDANSQAPLLHEAADEGRVAGQNAAGFPQDVWASQRKTPLSVVFCDPQIALVGMGYEQLEHLCPHGYAIGEVSFEHQGRSRVLAINSGLLRVYGEQGSNLLVGAEMIGPKAEHIAHLLAWVIQQRMTVTETLAMPFYHPVVEEGLRTALRHLNARLRSGPEMLENTMDCGPGG